MVKKGDSRVNLEEVREIPIANISPNPYQPRERFDAAALQELADSIREKGLLQPVVVRILDKDAGTYELVVGERRLRASKLLQKATISAIVRDIKADESRELALIENLQRDDLTVMEEARSLAALVEQHQGNQALVAQKVGKGVPYVHDRLNLLTLPEAVQELLDQGKINIAQAKVILELQGEEVKIEAARRAVRLNLTANELKGMMQRHLKSGGTSPKGERGGVITYSQLSNILVRLFDALDGYDFGMLGDDNKRTTLKKQLSLVGRALTEALTRLEAEPRKDASAPTDGPEKNSAPPQVV